MREGRQGDAEDHILELGLTVKVVSDLTPTQYFYISNLELGLHQQLLLKHGEI